MKRPSWDWFQWHRCNGWSFWTGQSSSRRLTILEVFHKLNGNTTMWLFRIYHISELLCAGIAAWDLFIFNLRWPAINLFQTSSQIPSQIFPAWFSSFSQAKCPNATAPCTRSSTVWAFLKAIHWVDVLLVFLEGVLYIPLVYFTYELRTKFGTWRRDILK